jgi:hypothetical protein
MAVFSSVGSAPTLNVSRTANRDGEDRPRRQHDDGPLGRRLAEERVAACDGEAEAHRGYRLPGLRVGGGHEQVALDDEVLDEPRLRGHRDELPECEVDETSHEFSVRCDSRRYSSFRACG